MVVVVVIIIIIVVMIANEGAKVSIETYKLDYHIATNTITNTGTGNVMWLAWNAESEMHSFLYRCANILVLFCFVFRLVSVSLFAVVVIVVVDGC